MRAVVVSDSPTFDPNRPMPTPAPGEALVRVTRAAICNTDIEILKGYFGFRGVLGHECVGVVESLDDRRSTTADEVSVVRRLASIVVGDRVVSEINCVPCDSPSRNYFERAQDPTRTTLGIDRHDGVFADYVCVPEVNLHRVPDSVSDDEAVFVEPLAATCQILEQVHIRPTDHVRVLGDGKLGLLCAQVLATATSAEVVAIGKHRNKLDLLQQRGICTMLLSEWNGMRDADVVVECTGSPGGFDTARRMLRPRGTLVLKSTYVNRQLNALTMTVVDEITIVGSRCGPFATALRLLEQQRVDVKPLIHARYPLEEGVQALEHTQRPGVLKVLLDICALQR